MGFMKGLAQKIPYSLGRFLSHVDYRYRLGKSYKSYKSDALNDSLDKDLVFKKMLAVVKFAEVNIKFYKDFYKKHGFSSVDLSSFEDISRIPVIKKSDLKGYSISERAVLSDSILTNTGGTSGQPLEIALEKSAYSREWGHMHVYWENVGYRIFDVKLTFRGMNLGSDVIRYNFIHNEFQVNAYAPFQDVFFALNELLSNVNISFIHGYPSSIYDFVKKLSSHEPSLLIKIKSNLKGVLLGSEYPAPHFRTTIETILGVKSFSWYGHSEMAVLAPEVSPFVYKPFHSYGYTEAIDMGGKFHLIGSSFDNFNGPLIRYDTGDVINPLSFRDDVLETFEIAGGRVGEYVVDKNGKNISLTALIFGRHHEIFNYVDFLQVKQNHHGAVDVYLIKNDDVDLDFDLFDQSFIDMDFNFIVRNKPFKTQSGKIPLLVN